MGLKRGGVPNFSPLTKFKKIEFICPLLPIPNHYIEIENQIKFANIQLQKSLNILLILFQSVLQNAFRIDSEIDEEPIFKELIKKIALDDLRGNKKRLQYLINLFQQNKFENEASYSDAKEKLFELILEGEVQ